MLNVQIEEQKNYLANLNHQIEIKENQLNIKKEKELNEKIQKLQKEIEKLKNLIEKFKKEISERDNSILNLKKIVSELNSMNKSEKKIINNKILEIEKILDLNFENKKIELQQLNIINNETNSQTQIKNLHENLFNKEKIINELNAQNFNLNNENSKLKEKINKIKNTFSELTNKFQKEIENKSKKDVYVNETNSKLFNEIITKNKNLHFKLNNLNDLCNKLKLEKFELENICLKQEEKLKKFKKKTISHSNSSFFLNEKYYENDQNYFYNFNKSNNINYNLIHSKNYSHKLFPIKENKYKNNTKKKNKNMSLDYSISLKEENNFYLPSLK